MSFKRQWRHLNVNDDDDDDDDEDDRKFDRLFLGQSKISIIQKFLLKKNFLFEPETFFCLN